MSNGKRFTTLMSIAHAAKASSVVINTKPNGGTDTHNGNAKDFALPDVLLQRAKELQMAVWLTVRSNKQHSSRK